MFLNLLAITVLAFGLQCALMPVQGAYTYQKLNELIPELRQFLGRTHLGTLKSRQFFDESGIQFRERKSNNLRNLMRIGKRHVPSSEVVEGADMEASAASGDPIYIISPNGIQSFRPQSVWLRR